MSSIPADQGQPQDSRIVPGRRARPVCYINKTLHIRRYAKPSRQVRFSIHPETVKVAMLRDQGKMTLAIETSRPDRVGLVHIKSGYYPMFRDLTPARGNCTLTLPTEEAADAFVPPDKRVYHPDVVVDPETGSLWFALPDGRSIHSLRPYFLNPWQDLTGFLADWSRQKRSRAPGNGDRHPSSLIHDPRLYDFDDTSILGSVSLDVPDELLRDPIRNGSPSKEHGFNPWNEDQKARIKEHLDAVASASMNGAPGSATG